MIISYASHQPIKVSNEQVTVIGTNSSVVYQDLLRGFRDGSQIKVCSDSYDELEVSKTIDLVGDVCTGGEEIERRYLSRITKAFLDDLTDPQRNRIHDSLNKLYNAVQEQLYMIDLPIEVTYDFDLKELTRFTKLHFDAGTANNPCAMIESILKVYEECHLKTTLIFTNVIQYLSTDQLREIEAMIKEMRVSVVLIEFTEMEHQDFYGNADFYYIDEDFVDWHNANH